MSLGRLSVKAYARHRKALGLAGGTPAGVRKALERLGIPRDDDGSFDADELHEAWEAERGDEVPPEGAPEGGTRSAWGEVFPAGGSPGNRDDPSGGMPKSEAVRRKEAALARKRELEVQVMAGELVYRDRVGSAWFEALRIVRDKMLGIPDRVAEILSGESDPKVVHKTLSEEIRQALELAADTVERAKGGADGGAGG